MYQQNTAIWNQLEGGWKQFRGKVREAWGRLTDDDLEAIRGQRDLLAGKLQERYGMTQDEANRQIDDWAAKLKL